MHEKRAVVDTAFHRYQLSGVREDILPETRTLYPHVVGGVMTSGPSVVSGSAHRPGLSIVGLTGAEVDSDSVSIYQDQMSFDDRERGAPSGPGEIHLDILANQVFGAADGSAGVRNEVRRPGTFLMSFRSDPRATSFSLLRRREATFNSDS